MIILLEKINTVISFIGVEFELKDLKKNEDKWLKNKIRAVIIIMVVNSS